LSEKHQPLNQEDLKKVEQALKRLRGITRGLRYGGYGQEYQLAQDALESWERIKPLVKQPRLL